MIETPPIGIVNNDLLNPSFEAVWLPVEIRRNLIPNATFESTTTTYEIWRNLVIDPTPLTNASGYWGGITGGTVTTTGSSVEVTTLGEGLNEGLRVRVNGRPTGETCSASIEVKAPVGAQLYAELRPNGFVSTAVRVDLTGTGTWERYTMDNASGGDLSSFHEIMVRTSATAAVTFEARRALIVAGEASPPYFDGDYSPEPDLVPSWTGEPNASPSILQGKMVSAWTRQPRITVTQSSVSKDAPFGVLIHRSSITYGGDVLQVGAFPIKVGSTYTFSAWVKRRYPVPTPASLLVRKTATLDSHFVLDTDEWTKVSATIVAESEDVSGGVFFVGVRRALGTGGTATLNDAIYVSDPMIVEGEYDEPYFDAYHNPFDSDYRVVSEGDSAESVSVVVADSAANHPYGISSDQWAVSGERSLRVPEPLQGGGVNLFSPSQVTNIAFGSTLVQGYLYRGYTIPVSPGEVYSLSRESVSNNRFRFAFTTEEPAAGVPYFGGSGNSTTYDNELAVEEIVVPSTALYMVLYFSNQQEDLPRIKLEMGDTATEWSAAPEDVAIVNLDAEQKFSIVARDAGQQVFLDGVLYHTTKQSPETVVVKSPGYVVLGEGFWDNGIVVRKDYDGPYFDGDTPSFRYRGQVVNPRWMYGDPGFVKSRLGEYYEVEPWTPTAEWSKPENRRYSIGADRGMLYRNGVGVPWSGLVSVSRNGNDGELGKRYLDGVLFNVSVPPSDFSASLEAFTYPDEFDACIGNANYNGVEGLTVHGQESAPFDLCYRTLQGDGNGYGEEYVLHFVYGCMAVDSGHDHATVNDSPEAETFSFEIHGVPQAVPNARPSAYFSIDSRKVNRGLLEGLEQVLYGTDGAQPRIPTMEEIETYFA